MIPSAGLKATAVHLERTRSSRLATQLREPAIRGAQLLTASGFALAQPLFDILGKNATFFAARESSVAEIVVLALVVTFLPAAVLLAIELVMGFVSSTAAAVLHIVFIAGLLAVVALHILARRDTVDGTAMLAVAALLGAGGGLLVWRTKFVSSLLTVLAPAPIVFLALFLFNSPVLKLISAETALATTVTVKSKTPVLLVVFDEFSSTSLMDRRGRIDAKRWPSFAALARNSSWYRNATTVHPHTEHAVPAILDGRLPKADELPILSDHPQNLFTFLGGSYGFEVVEGLTQLCPRKLCENSPISSYTASDGRISSLAHDLGVVYLHLVLPERYAAELPPIDRAWGNFGGAEQTEEQTTNAGSQTKADTCARNLCQLASRIKATKKPMLYFVHALLPHTPWLYLPSGRSYGGDVHKIPGLEKGTFGDDPWLATQAEQRYLLQLGYTDRALGILLRRLRTTGIYDRALVIVAADHGLGLRPNTALRNVARRNLADIAFAPLFVKLPGQRRGRIDDSFARTIDILPTIADVLGTELPWKADGRSLVGRPLPKDGSVSLLNSVDRPVSAPLSTLRRERALILSDRLESFGSGSLGRLYRIGPNAELLGRKVTSLPTRPSTRTNVELSQREVLAAVNPSSSFLPTYLSGVVTGRHPKQLDLAVAVNGAVRAVTRSYRELGETKFTALVPEHSFRAGANEVAVYAVTRTAAGWNLEQLRGTQLDYTLENGVLASSDGKVIRVTGGVSGEVRGARRGGDVTMGGWAADLKARRAAATIIVLVNGRSVFVGHNGNVSRNYARQRYGIVNAGFRFVLPGALVPSEGTPEVRVFARVGGIASELRYVPGYPWATGG